MKSQMDNWNLTIQEKFRAGIFQDFALQNVNVSTMYASALTSLLVIAQIYRELLVVTKARPRITNWMTCRRLFPCFPSEDEKYEEVRHSFLNLFISIDDVVNYLENRFCFYNMKFNNLQLIRKNTSSDISRSILNLYIMDNRPEDHFFNIVEKRFENFKNAGISKVGNPGVSASSKTSSIDYQNFVLSELSDYNSIYLKIMEPLLQFKRNLQYRLQLDLLARNFPSIIEDDEYFSKIEFFRQLRTAVNRSLEGISVESYGLRRIKRCLEGPIIKDTFSDIIGVLADPKYGTVRSALDPTNRSNFVVDCLLQTMWNHANTSRQCDIENDSELAEKKQSVCAVSKRKVPLLHREIKDIAYLFKFPDIIKTFRLC